MLLLLLAVAGQHPLIVRSINGVCGLLPVSRSLLPLLDLAVVLGGRKGSSFEPLQATDLKIVSLKRVLLLAIV